MIATNRVLLRLGLPLALPPFLGAVICLSVGWTQTGLVELAVSFGLVVGYHFGRKDAAA